MSNPDGSPMPLPTDEVEKGAAVIGRTPEGMIFMVLPPMVVGVTFMLLTGNHISATCEFVNGLAYHMNNEDILDLKVAPPKLVQLLRDNMLERHGIKEPMTEGVVKKGTKETFEGSYYAEIHPIELAAVGVVIDEIRATMPKDLHTPTIDDVLELWHDAARAFVKDTERLALAGDAGVA